LPDVPFSRLVRSRTASERPSWQCPAYRSETPDLPPMKPSVLDVICLGGSLAVAISWRALTGDGDTADRIGLCLLMSWAILQTIRFVVHRPQ